MHARDLQRAAHILRHGGVVAYATEHCFGLGCDPFNRAAVLRLLHIKRRSMAKGLIVLAGDVKQLGLFAERIPAEVTATWPGPHTWLLATRVSVPKWITGAHPQPARTDREVRRRFGKLVDYVLPGFVGGAPAPTPIRDAVTGERIRD